MQKRNQKSPDFFSQYRLTRIKQYIFSSGIAVFVAFGFVSMIHSDIDPRGLMASVANVSDAPHYEADIVMTRQGGDIMFILGKSAQKVDTIDLTLLGDPSRLSSITASSPDIHITSQGDMGVYRISVDMHGQDIVAGTQVTSLRVTIDTGATLALSDTEFVSGGVRYSLSSQGE